MHFSDSDTDGEHNAHLHERFGGSSRFSGNARPTFNDNIPTSVPFRPNNDIREYVELGRKTVHGAGAWVSLPEIPSTAEILEVSTGFRSSYGSKFGDTNKSLVNVEESIRPKKVTGPYDDKEDYLRTEYELLREDAIRPLREAVQEIRADPWKDEGEYQNHAIGIYEPVYIKSLVFSPRGIATRVAFSLSRVKKHIRLVETRHNAPVANFFPRWEQSKRLITGSLVALSPMEDVFETTCILATVAARPVAALAQNPPEIDLFFSHSDQQIDPTKRWIMIECRSSFFEASKHTLAALQHMMREPFPLSEYLVNAQKEVKPPAYVQDNPYTDLSSLIAANDSTDLKNVHILEDWPSRELQTLDESQSKALKDMLTSELALVQGPPGTGKVRTSLLLPIIN
jgi:helicase required for RNAi-mediated heterochromatin assembly 1